MRNIIIETGDSVIYCPFCGKQYTSERCEHIYDILCKDNNQYVWFVDGKPYDDYKFTHLMVREGKLPFIKTTQNNECIISQPLEKDLTIHLIRNKIDEQIVPFDAECIHNYLKFKYPDAETSIDVIEKELIDEESFGANGGYSFAYSTDDQRKVYVIYSLWADFVLDDEDEKEEDAKHEDCVNKEPTIDNTDSLCQRCDNVYCISKKTSSDGKIYDAYLCSKLDYFIEEPVHICRMFVRK